MCVVSNNCENYSLFGIIHVHVYIIYMHTFVYMYVHVYSVHILCYSCYTVFTMSAVVQASLLEQQLADKTRAAESHVQELTHLRTVLAKEKANNATLVHRASEKAARCE